MLVNSAYTFVIVCYLTFKNMLIVFHFGRTILTSGRSSKPLNRLTVASIFSPKYGNKQEERPCT